MKLVADLHCHTIASEHAYSTLQELAAAARERGLEIIAITDHGIAFDKGPSIYYFTNMRSIPDTINGVRILKGVEANIMDYNGTLDMPENMLEKLDIVIASFHDIFINPGTIRENTDAAVKVLQNPLVDVLGHPDNPYYPIDIDEVVSAAKEYNKLIELNNNSYYVRRGSENYTAEIAKTAKKYGTKISCGSDAHISYDIGKFEIINKVIKENEIPEDIVINTSMEKVIDYLKLNLN